MAWRITVSSGFTRRDLAYGALATPIITLAAVTSGVNDDPGLTVDTLGAMVGRQTPILAFVVPLVLVFVVDGMRGVRHTWQPALLAGVSFGVAQFVASNYISVPLTDIVAALVAAAAVVLLLRVWKPAEVVTTADMEHSVGHQKPGGETPVGAVVGGSPGEQSADVEGSGGRTGAGAERAPTPTDRDTTGEVAKAYAPYLAIIAIFSIANTPAVKEALAEKPWTLPFQWPGLSVANSAGEPLASMTYNFNWFPAAGTLMIFAGILTAIILKISPRRMLKTYAETYVELKWAIVTVMAVLALAYVMNMSGQTTTLGAWLAQTGGLFVVLSPILGWLGVAVTGSDTSANALFGALQVQTAAKAGLDPVLLAAANSSGGVLGKMISPQNLAIAAAAVGMAGKEGEIFRKVFLWSMVMLAFMCLIVALQATAVLGWMVL